MSLRHAFARGRRRDRRHRRVVSMLVCCAVAHVCLPAGAAAEWQLSASLGAAHTGTSTLHLEQPAESTALSFNEVTWRGESFRSPLFYSGRVTWFRDAASRVGLEAEFTHAKAFLNTDRPSRVSGTLEGQVVDARVPIDTLVQRLSESHGLNLLLGNVVGRIPLGGSVRDARTTVLLRAGAGATIPHVESTIRSQADEHYEWGGVAAQVGAGLAVRLTSRWMGTADLRWSAAPQHVRVAAGSASSTLRTVQGTFGLAWSSARR